MSTVATLVAQGAQRLRNDAFSALSAIRSYAAPFSRDLNAYLPDDLVQRIVWVVPEDALADGWSTDSDDEQDTTRDLDAELHLEHSLIQAAGMARLGDGAMVGGAFLWIVYESDTDYKTPAPEGSKVAAIHAVSCTELRPVSWERDPRSQNLGLPKSYSVTLTRGGMSWYGVEVHASRLIYVPGLRRPAAHSDTEAGRDWSVVKVYREAMQGVDQGFSSAARLLQRRSVPVVTHKGGSASSDQGDDNGLKARMLLFRKSLSVHNLAVLLGDDTLSWQGPAVSGTSELVTSLAWRLAIPEGIPLTKLLGQPPSGMTSDDMAAEKTYHALLSRWRKTLGLVLLQVYDRVLGPDPSRRIVWPPLDEPTDKERAETQGLRAQRDVAYVTADIWTREEVRQRFADGEETDIPLMDDAAWAAGAAWDAEPVPPTMTEAETAPPVIEEEPEEEPPDDGEA